MISEVLHTTSPVPGTWGGLAYPASHMLQTSTEVGALYGEIPPLAHFSAAAGLPLYRYMSCAQVLELAEEVVDKIAVSPFKRVVVMESGAAPLAEICRGLARGRGLDLEWNFIKVPRELGRLICPMCEYYLTDAERECLLPESIAEEVQRCVPELAIRGLTRSDALRELCTQLPASFTALNGTLEERLHCMNSPTVSPWHSAFSLLVAGTGLERLCAAPFLLLDEYVTSGTVLSNSHQFFSLLSQSLEYRIGCYLINVGNPEDFGVIEFALHDIHDRASCFSKGVYPFENRVDLCGGCYATKGGRFEWQSLEELIAESSPRQTTRGILAQLEQIVRAEALVSQGQALCTEPGVRAALCESDFVRFGLYRLEALHGAAQAQETPIAPRRGTKEELLYQLFEMYGPPWLPLPLNMHREFEAVFRALEQRIDKLFTPECRDLYARERADLLSEIGRVCLSRRKEWQRRMEVLLEEKMYEYRKSH